MFEIEEVSGQRARLRVVGIGGAGGNAINSMIASNLQGVDFVAINTDLQALDMSLAPVKVQIGSNLTRGLGAGSDPRIGREAALEDKTAIMETLEDSDMVFITAGFGGGTGTGAGPVVASIAQELGVLTVAVVTKPFNYEGRIRTINAEEGLKELRKYVDTLIVIPNDKINLVVEKSTPLVKAFALANEVLKMAVQSISDIILVPGLINVDFADVRTIIENKGRGVMGFGMGKGEGAAMEAAKRAVSNPLLEDSSIDGARAILINITGGLMLPLDDIQEAASFIYDSAHEEVNLIFGAVIDPDLDDEVKITVIATGFSEEKEKVELPQIRKWSSLRRPVNLKGADRILAKTLGSDYVEKVVPTDLVLYEDPMDVPTFLRKTLQKEI